MVFLITGTGFIGRVTPSKEPASGCEAGRHGTLFSITPDFAVSGDF